MLLHSGGAVAAATTIDMGTSRRPMTGGQD